jgi:hypothetical protein
MHADLVILSVDKWLVMCVHTRHQEVAAAHLRRLRANAHSRHA